MSQYTRASAHASLTAPARFGSARALVTGGSSRLAAAGLAAFLVVGLPVGAHAQGPSAEGVANGVANGPACNSGLGGTNNGVGNGNTGMPEESGPEGGATTGDPHGSSGCTTGESAPGAGQGDNPGVGDGVGGGQDGNLGGQGDDPGVGDGAGDDPGVGDGVAAGDDVGDGEDTTGTLPVETVVEEDPSVFVDPIPEPGPLAGEGGDRTGGDGAAPAVTGPSDEVLGDEAERAPRRGLDVRPSRLERNDVVVAPAQVDEILGVGAVNRPAAVVLPDTGAADRLGFVAGLGAVFLVAGSLLLTRRPQRVRA